MLPVVLVVDDSMLVRYTVCRFFEERGFHVESATDGQQALQKLQNIQPCLIVTDVQMPRMNGLELIAALSSQPKHASIPVIVVARRRRERETLEAAAAYVIYKDIDINEQLAKAVAALLGSQFPPQA